MKEMEKFDHLVEIMDRLRDPEGGCPWDREQDYGTLRSYLIEECHEVAEAIDHDDRGALREELGDLLFQIVFLSRLAKEEGAFTAADVVRGIAEKMIRRHPHVFGDDEAETSEDVLRSWEEIKRREKQDKGHDDTRSVLAGIPRSLPAMLKAHRLGTKAARVGFDWPDTGAILEKVDEELGELKRAVDDGASEAVAEELGDLLFAIVMLARRTTVDPEQALERANRKFRERFGAVEEELRRRGVAVEDAGLELLDRLWNDVKRAEGR
jgi:MazG family protein